MLKRSTSPLRLACFAGVVAGSAAVGWLRAETQSDLNERAYAEFREADRALNGQYAALRETLDDEGREKLKAAQRAWIKFRDADAEFAADEFRRGSIMPLIEAKALRRLTEARTEELARHLADRQTP